MNAAEINDAIREAERFITKARAALRDSRTSVYLENERLLNPGAASSGCRRASMDLTRALATMRKPG